MASCGPAGYFAGHLSGYPAPGAPKSRDCPMTQAVLVIHGGAGAISRAKTTPAIVQEYRSALQATLARGSAILADGGSALDAVCEAVRLLEECALDRKSTRLNSSH